MQHPHDQFRPGQTSLTLVLDARTEDPDLGRSLEQAGQALSRLPLDWEILVIGEAGGESGVRAAPEAARQHPRVRYVPGGGTGGYAGMLRAAAAVARGSLVAVADGAVDLRALAYLVPLAEQYPVVWGWLPEPGGPWWGRCLSRAFNGLARVLLHTGVRDCDGGAVLSVVQRSILANVLPRAEGFFARAEVVVRARQHGLAVAEVPVPPGDPPARRPGPTWRAFRGAVARCVGFWWSGVQFAGPAPAPPRPASWLGGVVLALLAALILFHRLNQPLLDPDEGRQAEIPREMLAHHDLLLPRLLGEPYYEKPPLQYWLTAAAYEAFGLHGRTARLVPALAAWLTVLGTYAWGRYAFGARPAFLSALGLCLTPGFVVLGRTVVLDSLLGCCVAASWYTAQVAVRGPGLRRGWWAASALACGLGMLAKGPVALALLAVPVLAYQTLNPTAARPRGRPWAFYLGLALSVAAPWYVAMAAQDPDYLRQFLWRANVVRFFNPYDHEQPCWFYLPVLFAATLPWSLLWPALVYFLVRRSPRLRALRGPGLGFCVLAVGWCFLFYSLSGCKSPPYLAPLLSPLALLLGACVDAMLFHPAGHRDPYLGRVRRALPWQAALLILIISGACYLTTSLAGWQPWGWALGKAAVSAVVMGVWWRFGRHRSPRLAWGVCATLTLLFVTLALRDLLGGYASRHSPAPLARLVERLAGAARGVVISYGRQWNSASFYLRRDVVVAFDDQHHRDLVVFLEQQPRTLVLVESGPPLQTFLGLLPPTLRGEVHPPAKEGQTALVVVWRAAGEAKPPG
jgi:dolichol-phosphate mannosyltransferase